MSELEYRPQFDGLRALAVMAVLYSHFWDSSSQWGHQGVRLFFILSGFLITGILQRPTTLSFRVALAHFYARRALRIFPAYYLAVLLASALIPEVRAAALWLFTYTVNFLFALTGKWEPWQSAPLWSLAVEEQFYLFWAPFVLLADRRRLIFWTVLAIGLSPIFRIIIWHLSHNDIAPAVLLPASFDALGAGAMLAIFRGRWRGRRCSNNVLLLISGGGLALQPVLWMFGLPAWFDIGPSDTIALIPLVGLVVLANRGDSKILSWGVGSKAMRYIGKISYGIYLYHAFVLSIYYWGASEISWPGWLPYDRGPGLFLVCTTATIACASLSWAFLEAPLNQMKRRFPHSAAGGKGIAGS